MAATDNRTAMTLAEEYFAAEDARFVEAIRDVSNSEQLAAFADRWKQDSRPWARRQAVDYLEHSPDCVGHQPVVKRLFKQAEENGDDELMGAFAVLFDRLVRHERKTRWQYDWESRSTWQEEYLSATAPALPYGIRSRKTQTPQTGEKFSVPDLPDRRGAIYFTYATRYYLQRRAWRYFRHLGYGDPPRYVRAVATMLARYRDAHLARGEHILDSWTLLQACFRESDVLDFGRTRIRLAAGRSLGELRAAPRFLECWQTDEAFDLLIGLLDTARSRLVRVWAIQLLKAEHETRIAGLPAEKLLSLLRSRDPDVQQFAARLLKDNQELGRVPIATWLALLDLELPTALDAISQAIEQHVAPERLSLAECVALALREPTPIAQLGFDWLRQRTVESLEDRQEIAELADTACVALAGEMADWALGVVGSRAFYDRDLVLRFIDSSTPAVRERAWEWLEAPECPGRDDPVLFCRLMETPFDDLRLRLVDLLQQRSLPGEATPGLTHVWTSVLLGVARGGRQKLKAVHQIADAIIANPALADELLPVLAIAVRSVRKPEARAGLAAVVATITRNPRTAEAVARHLPELELVEAPA